MKLLYKSIEKDDKGHISLVPEEPQDMWHTYNLISKGDSLKASTIRKVQTESATGSSSSNRVRTILTLRVETTDFDIQAGVLRVKGRNVEENQYVKMGAYHTIDLELNRKFTLYKNCWDLIALDRVDQACDPAQHADLAAVIMQDGIANICLVTSAMTIDRAKIEMNIPRKRKGSCAQHEKGLTKFYDSVVQAILRHVNFDVVKCVLIGSPGFVKDQFFEYMYQQAVKTDNKALLENKGKFLLVHTSSGFKHSLREVLSDPVITTKLTDTKAAGEVRALEIFYNMLQSDPDRAYYGLSHVEKACEANAIETLLLTDKLFMSFDLAMRKKYVALVESVKDNGGEVRVFSSLHVSGEQLDQLSGIAAVLRFPLHGIEDGSGDDYDDDD